MQHISLSHDLTLTMPTRSITLTSLWPRWRLKSPASRLFTQSFIQGRSKKTSKLCVTGLCAGNSPGPMNSPHKGPVTRKMFPLMTSSWYFAIDDGNKIVQSTNIAHVNPNMFHYLSLQLPWNQSWHLQHIHPLKYVHIFVVFCFVLVVLSQHNTTKWETWQRYISWYVLYGWEFCIAKIYICFCCVLFCWWYDMSYSWQLMINLSIFFGVAALTLGHSFHCPNSRAVTLP